MKATVKAKNRVNGLKKVVTLYDRYGQPVGKKLIGGMHYLPGERKLVKNKRRIQKQSRKNNR